MLHTYCRHIHDCCLINVYMIMFNACTTALVCLDGYVKTADLITDRLRIALTLIIDSCSETWHL